MESLLRNLLAKEKIDHLNKCSGYTFGSVSNKIQQSLRIRIKISISIHTYVMRFIECVCGTNGIKAVKTQKPAISEGTL